MWRLIAERVCTLAELETTWSLDDVLRMNAVLDMRAYYANEKQKEQGGNRGRSRG